MKIINHQFLNAPCQRDVKATALAVLTQDDSGQYAVYLGVTIDPWTTDNASAIEEAKTWVAHNGAKLSYRAASVHFDIKEEDYRA